MGVDLLIGSLIMTAISTAVGITTSIVQAQAQAKLQKQQAKAQAENLRQQAEQEEQEQLQRSMVERRQMARRLASAEAEYASSGVTLQGTPTLSLASMAEEQELEIAMQEASSGYKRSLMLANADNTVAFGNAGASLTESSGYWNAVGTGLSGTASMASTAYQGYKDGTFTWKKDGLFSDSSTTKKTK